MWEDLLLQLPYPFLYSQGNGPQSIRYSCSQGTSFWMGEGNAFLAPLHEASRDRKYLDFVYFEEFILYIGILWGVLEMGCLCRDWFFMSYWLGTLFHVWEPVYTINHRSWISSSSTLAAVFFPIFCRQLVLQFLFHVNKNDCCKNVA